MKQTRANEVREATAELDATTGAEPQPSATARACEGGADRNEVTCGMGVSRQVSACTDARRATCCEGAGNETATRLRHQDANAAARPSQRNETERDLVRDTEAYLDERTRGLTPSLRQCEAWDCFFRYGSAVIRGATRAFGLSEADRDDCEQEFWAAVVDQLGRSRYEPVRAGLRTWLSALARNKSTDVIRQRTRHASRNLNEVGVFEIPCREADPASAYELKEKQALVHSALAALSQVVSDRSYQVLHLRSIEELNVSEVALTLGLSLEEVRYRHFRAKQELRRLVEISEW
jgi:RNA polymerase sigma factor (sigma-70 family)